MNREMAGSYASPGAYAASRGSTRAVTRCLKRRRRVIGADEAGEAILGGFGNSAQAALAAFKAGDPVPGPAPGPDSDSGISKSRSDRW